MNAKRIFAIVGGVIMGAFLTWRGVTELVHSVQLQKRGKPAAAQVVSGREHVTSRLRIHSYYLTVAFKDDAGRAVNREVKVSEATYDAGLSTHATKAFYLPEDPEICAAGEVVDLRYGNLVYALVFLGMAGFLAVSMRTPANLEQLASRVEEKLKPMLALRHEYAPADPAEFKHLDLAFYDEGQHRLEREGYSFVANRENLTITKTNNRRTLLRLLLSGDRTTQAFLYHFKVGAETSSKDAKVLDLQTQLSNGTFVCTSNAKNAGKFESPLSVFSEFLPEASWDTVLETHARRLAEHLEKRAGVTPVTINGLEEFQRVMDNLQKLKGEFRRQQGLSQAELERISGKSGPEITQLADLLKSRWATRGPELAQA